MRVRPHQFHADLALAVVCGGGGGHDAAALSQAIVHGVQPGVDAVELEQLLMAAHFN